MCVMSLISLNSCVLLAFFAVAMLVAFVDDFQRLWYLQLHSLMDILFFVILLSYWVSDSAAAAVKL